MGYRIIVFTTIVFGCLLSLTMRISADYKKPIPAKNETGLARDLRLLRKTVTLPAPPLQASSADACGAAARIFSRLKFVGMSKEHVLWVLGDPETISDYGLKPGSKADAPLKYIFSSGLGGNEFWLEFKDGRVTQVQKKSQE